MIESNTSKARQMLLELNAKEREEVAELLLASLSPEYIVSKLDPKKKDAVYRLLWAAHVAEDVRSHAEDMDICLTTGEVEVVVNRYVYDGDYDCSLSYWDNLEALIEDATKDNEQNL